MIYSVKKILYKILKEPTYLRLLHRVFYLMYDLGLLKKDARFKYHYFVKDIIEPNFNIVDIGANLGYFSKTFSRLASKGSVTSIEPVPAFYDVLKYFIGSKHNVTIYNNALGTKEGTIVMVMPETDGMIRTGLPHIAENDAEKERHKNQEVKIVKGSELLGNIDRIDYIKCDIEGYEATVFQEIKGLIIQHQPIIQIEIDPKNEKEMGDYFKELNYLQYGISNFKVVRDYEMKQQEQGDFLFIPASKQAEFEEKMKAKKRM